MGNWWTGPSLSSLRLYTSKFTFSRQDANDLTKDELEALMDAHKIPSEKRLMSSFHVIYRKAGKVKAKILVLVRSKRRLYDVVIAKGSMQRALDKTRYQILMFFAHADHRKLLVYVVLYHKIRLNIILNTLTRYTIKRLKYIKCACYNTQNIDEIQTKTQRTRMQ